MVYKLWRGAGVVERGGLENRCALAYPGFESLSLRQANRALNVLKVLLNWLTYCFKCKINFMYRLLIR